MTVHHLQRAREAWLHLAYRANTGLKPFTYRELSEHVGCHPRSARWYLGVIQRHCAEHNLPALQALAVYKATGLPGSGYLGSRRTPEAHAAELARVYTVIWPTDAPF
ncbi:hypothetical protein [uncultured Methylobacterium sp.]|uniref:hypothetical protein n=1 Tax=uncultured Methylobacterium sp. TaxID=157278 RepID=UPI0035CAAFE7